MMSEKCRSDVEYLESLADSAMPEGIADLSPEVLSQFILLVDDILIKERAGLDGLFDSMTHGMKFIPNLLLQTLTNKYIEPPIAARIASRLSFKQSLGITSGLPIPYIVEAARYLETGLAAELVEGMNKKKSVPVLGTLAERYPLRALDVCSHVSDKLLRACDLLACFDGLDREHLNDARQQTLDRI